MGALEDGIGLDFGRPQRRRRVGREEGVAGAAGEDDHPSLLEVADGLRRMYCSATFGISSAVITRVGWSRRSRLSWRASAFMTVAIIPM